MAAVCFFKTTWMADDGTNLPDGSYIRTKLTATNTNKAAYTSSTAGTAHANPVTIPDDGRLQLWLLTDANYDIFVYDNDDNLIESFVNVTGVGFQTFSTTLLTADLDVATYDIKSSSNRDIDLSPHGTGDVVVKNDTLKVAGTATQAGRLILGENTGNGTNTGTIAAPESLTGDRAWAMQDVSGTILMTNGTDVPIADGGTGASSASAAATNLGLGTGDSPQFTAVNIGHATDTTVARVSAGDISVEGNLLYRAGGTDVPISDGGTGQSTAAAAFSALSPITTTGDMIYSSSGTTNSRLAIGTLGQGLKSSGTAPSWVQGFWLETSASGAAAASISTSNITSPSSIKMYKLVISLSVATAGANLYLTISTDNASSYLGASTYSAQHVRCNGTTVTGSATAAGAQIILDAAVGLATGSNHTFEIDVYQNVAGTDTNQYFKSSGLFFINGGGTTTAFATINSHGLIASGVSTGITNFKLAASSGNITGAMNVYTIRG